MLIANVHSRKRKQMHGHGHILITVLMSRFHVPTIDLKS